MNDLRDGDWEELVQAAESVDIPTWLREELLVYFIALRLQTNEVKPVRAK